MRAGPLNRYVSLIRNVQVGTSAYNTPIYEETTVSEFWAALVPKSEAEQYAASQIYSTVVVVFRAHYLAGVLVTDKLECDGVTYDIVGSREIGFRAGIEITAKVVT